MQTVDRVACVALAGVCAEYLLFGRSEGGLGDIRQLDAILRGVGFSQKKADSEVCILNGSWFVLMFVRFNHFGSDAI